MIGEFLKFVFWCVWRFKDGLRRFGISSVVVVENTLTLQCTNHLKLGEQKRGSKWCYKCSNVHGHAWRCVQYQVVYVKGQGQVATLESKSTKKVQISVGNQTHDDATCYNNQWTNVSVSDVSTIQ